MFLGNIGVILEKCKNIVVIIEKFKDERFLNNVLNVFNGLCVVGGINIDFVVVIGGFVEIECIYF